MTVAPQDRKPQDRKPVKAGPLARIVLHFKALRCSDEPTATKREERVSNSDSRRPRRIGQRHPGLFAALRPGFGLSPGLAVATDGYRSRSVVVSAMDSAPALAGRPRLLVTSPVPAPDEESTKRTDRAELLGLAFDLVTMDTAVARCLDMCRAPRTSHLVVTANASHLCMMRHDPELAMACRAGSLTVADGMSVE